MAGPHSHRKGRHFKKGQKALCSCWGIGMRTNVRITSLQTPKWENKAGNSKCHRRNSLSAHGETMVEQVHTCSLWRGPLWNTGYNRADTYSAAHGGYHVTADRYTLKETEAWGEPMLKQVHDRNCGEKSMQEQVFLQELWPMKHLCWSSLVLKDCSPCRSPILELWKNVRRKAHQRWIVVDWSQLPISYSPCAPWGVGVTGAGDEGVKFSLGKSMGERHCYFLFVSHNPILFLTIH